MGSSWGFGRTRQPATIVEKVRPQRPISNLKIGVAVKNPPAQHASLKYPTSKNVKISRSRIRAYPAQHTTR